MSSSLLVGLSVCRFVGCRPILKMPTFNDIWLNTWIYKEESESRKRRANNKEKFFFLFFLLQIWRKKKKLNLCEQRRRLRRKSILLIVGRKNGVAVWRKPTSFISTCSYRVRVLNRRWRHSSLYQRRLFPWSPQHRPLHDRPCPWHSGKPSIRSQCIVRRER